jgi:DNA-binding protein Fis
LVNHTLVAAQSGRHCDAYAQIMEVVERELLSQAIDLAQGNQAKAARWLGISRLTLREKLQHYGLHPRLDTPGG